MVSFNSFTTQDKVKQADGSIGVLTITNLNLNVNVFTSSDDMLLDRHTKAGVGVYYSGQYCYVSLMLYY